MPDKSTAPSIIAAIVLLLAPTTATAQDRTFYGPDGRVSGRAHTDSQGNVTTYDASGRVTGRASTNSDGSMTVYDADGRRIGTTAKPKPGGQR